MKIQDVYHLTKYKYRPKSFFNNDNRSGADWTWNFAQLIGVHVPSASRIIQAQKEAALAYIQTFRYSKSLQQLNKDLLKVPGGIGPTNFVSINEIIAKTLENITDDDFYSIAFLKKSRFKDLEQLTSVLKNNSKQLENTVNQLRMVYNYFISQKEKGVIPFPQKVNTQLENLNSVLQLLEGDLNQIKNNPDVTKIIGTLADRIGQSGGNQGYLAYTRNIANELKGFLLPLETIKYYNQYAEKIGQHFIDTGSWQNSKGQEIPIDMFGIRDSSKIFFTGNINGANYNNTPLNEIEQILKDLAKEQVKATVTIADYDSLIAQLENQNASLIQSKAGRFTPNLNSQFSTTAEQTAWMAKYTNEGKALLRLLALKQIYSCRIYVSHEYYDALFSYCLSKQMDSILGDKYNVILTPAGLMPIDQWIKTQMVTMYYQPRFTLNLNAKDKEVPIALK